jgi:hypothetical protein
VSLIYIKYLFYNKLGHYHKKTTKANKRQRNDEIYGNLNDEEEIAEHSNKKSSNYHQNLTLASIYY